MIKLFYEKDKKNTILYVTTSLLIVPVFFLNLYVTKQVVDFIQTTTVSSFEFKEALYLIGVLNLVLYIGGISHSIKAISTTNLIVVDLYTVNNSILEKTAALRLSDIESALVKTTREKATRLSFITVLEQWVSIITNAVCIEGLFLLLLIWDLYALVLLIVAILFIQIKMSKWISRKIEQLSRQQASSNRVYQYIVDLLVSRKTIPEIRVYNMYTYLRSKMKSIFFTNFNAMQKHKYLSETIHYSNDMISTLLKAISILVLVIVLARDGATAGAFVMLFQVVTQLYSLIPSLIEARAGLEQSKMRFEDYESYMMMEEDKVPRNKQPVYSAHKQASNMEVIMNDVTFKYPTNERATLKQINLRIKAGSRVAFVGENGSGKSTLIKLILGLYEPTIGTIRWFNGHAEIRSSDVAASSRIIFQDFARLLRPIRENVAIGDTSKLADDTSLHRALTKANAYHFAKELDTAIGPQFGGVDLSGGQWQRLATSRAYLKKDSTLTIFDEPTAALDPNSEKKAFETFIQLGDKQTSILITHRLYMAKFVDEIFMLQDGEIVEQGTHQELMKAKGSYAKMFTKQSSLYSLQNEEVL